MSATGALTTKMFVSPLRPTSRTQAGYEALDTRTITPSDLSSNVFTIPEADYVAVVSGDPTTISADIAPLVDGHHLLHHQARQQHDQPRGTPQKRHAAKRPS